MSFPSVPLTRMVDDYGNVTSDWRIYFEQLTTRLQTTLFVTLENLTTAEIAAIPSGERNGRMIFDTDLGALFMGANDSFIAL